MHEPNLAQDRAGLPPIDALERILAAAGGSTTRLNVPAGLEHVGLALFLLVNRSIRHDHARPLTRHHWVCIDPLICEMAEAFVDGLGQPRRSMFWRGSGLAGLRTLLGRNLAVVQDDSGFASELCITDPAAALDRIVRFLRRRAILAAQAGIGFDALVATYRQPRLDRPGLASFGQGGEWPADTPRLRARLLALVEGTAGPLPVIPGLRAW